MTSARMSTLHPRRSRHAVAGPRRRLGHALHLGAAGLRWRRARDRGQLRPIPREAAGRRHDRSIPAPARTTSRRSRPARVSPRSSRGGPTVPILGTRESGTVPSSSCCNETFAVPPAGLSRPTAAARRSDLRAQANAADGRRSRTSIRRSMGDFGEYSSSTGDSLRDTEPLATANTINHIRQRRQSQSEASNRAYPQRFDRNRELRARP
jgi:hypothetical protein